MYSLEQGFNRRKEQELHVVKRLDKGDIEEAICRYKVCVTLTCKYSLLVI